MKNIFSKPILVVISVVLLAVGCGTNRKNDGVRLTVISTIFPGYDFSRALTKDIAGIDLKMLLKPGGESHSYEPSPQDIIDIENADVFIYVGGESDAWVDDLLTGIDAKKLRTVKLMDLVSVKEEELTSGMQDEERKEGKDEEPSEIEYDEHVWTSPVNAMKIVNGINDVLVEIDPENAESYRKNADEYIKELKSLDENFKKITSEGNRKKLIFGDRFPFRYFADEYGLVYDAAFPGCSTETEASAKTIATLIDEVKQEKIPVVFYIEFSNQKIADTIKEASNTQTRLFHSTHNISKADWEKGVTYIDLMKANAEVLKEAVR